VQKERIQPEDIFVLLRSTREHLRSPEKPLKQSACTPLFFNAYDHRNAGACIHTHSQHAVMVTLLWPGKEFKISHQEMIKGMRIGGIGNALSCECFFSSFFLRAYVARLTECSSSDLDTLTIPIIENTPDEEDLRFDMEKALIEYPDA
jgi:methylthioribulose-1-phosphate dehydratase